MRGPLPLSWFMPAAVLPGKALHVGMAIWFEYGRRKRDQFKLSSAMLKRFGVERKAGYSGLNALTECGLITVHRESGKNPIITIIKQHDDKLIEEDENEI